MIGSTAINVLGGALLSGYGREHELEADRLGAEYLARTGYDPQAMQESARRAKESGAVRRRGRKPRAEAARVSRTFSRSTPTTIPACSR